MTTYVQSCRAHKYLPKTNKIVQSNNRLPENNRNARAFDGAAQGNEPKTGGYKSIKRIRFLKAKFSRSLTRSRSTRLIPIYFSSHSLHFVSTKMFVSSRSLRRATHGIDVCRVISPSFSGWVNKFIVVSVSEMRFPLRSLTGARSHTHTRRTAINDTTNFFNKIKIFLLAGLPPWLVSLARRFDAFPFPLPPSTGELDCYSD